MRRGALLFMALAAVPAGAFQIILSDVTITTKSLPDGQVGESYSAPLSLKGGRPLFRWSVSGELPPGLSLEPIAGVISGTPTAAGNFKFTLRVTDGGGKSDSQGLDITIRPAPAANPLVISTTSLPTGAVGAPYSATLSASGGAPPYSWAATGLPAGLALSNNQIGGAPTQPGTFSVTVQVTDSAASSATGTFSIVVSAALAITTGGLPGGKVGSSYSAPLAATGGAPPYSWSVSSGALPAGLSVSGSQITGTPTSAGTADFTIRVTDGSGASATKALSINVSSNAPPLALSTGSLAPARVGVAYNQPLAATGGTPPYSWSVSSGSLPAGLTVSGSEISGTPSGSGTARFSIQVRDSAGETASADFTLTVTAPVAIASPAQLPGGAAREPYSYSMQATGGTAPYTWALASGSLPPGLNLSNGTISGTPEQDGTYQFSVRVSDSAGASASGAFSITIAQGLSITSTSPLPAAAAGTAYSQALAALAGRPPYRWDIVAGSLPAGLSLNPTTGVVSGTPTDGGSYSFTVQVSDSAGAVVSKQFTMTVVSALAITTATQMPGGVVGAPYSQSLAAVAGTSPYTWAVVSGALPPGLSLNPSTGSLTGTPTETGTFSFTVQVRDTLSASASKALTISVSQSVALATGSPLPSGTAGRSYSQQLRAVGGVPPYSWSVSAGALPAGLALDGSGSLAGTPQAAGDFEFTLRIADAAGASGSAAVRLHVGLDPLPTVAISGLSDSADPLGQPQLGVSIAAPYPVAIAGQLVLTFTPDATVPGDDPAIQFSTGGRTVDFTIPANSTQVRLPAAQIALQTGSVAGTITVTAVLKAGGVDGTPSPAPARSIKIARSAPVIRSLKMVKTASGFEIWITGYSPSRDLARATFRFTPASGSDLRTSTADLTLTDSARQWYQDPASKLFGSQFTIVQPFTVQGSTDAIGTIHVTLANSAGTSAEAQVP